MFFQDQLEKFIHRLTKLKNQIENNIALNPLLTKVSYFVFNVWREILRVKKIHAQPKLILMQQFPQNVRMMN